MGTGNLEVKVWRIAYVIEVLCVSNLPKDVTDDMLAHIFKFPGFKLVRMVPGKDDLAFVDFETPEQALVAKTALDGNSR
jgi:hypothetical protein